MRDFLTDSLAIVFACLFITALAGALVVFRPGRRRRRRHKRHSSRKRIDLFSPARSEPDSGADA